MLKPIYVNEIYSQNKLLSTASLIIGIIHYKTHIHKSMYSLCNLPTEEKEGELKRTETLKYIDTTNF